MVFLNTMQNSKFKHGQLNSFNHRAVGKELNTQIMNLLGLLHSSKVAEEFKNVGHI